MTAISFLAAELLVTHINTRVETLTDFEVASGAKPSSPVAASRYNDYRVINTRNLFNTSRLKNEVKIEGPPSEPSPAPDKPLTELKLKLLGTVVGIPFPIAIILNLKTKKQDIYRKGDAVTEEATLEEIYRNKVILNHGGKHEMLLAFESGLPGGDAEKEKSVSTKKRNGKKTGRFDLGNLGRKVSQYRWELDREEVSHAVENASKLLTQIRIVPHFEKGKLDKPDGFQISHVKPGGFFDKLGIIPGDIIKEVNGEPVNSPEKAFSAYQKFKSEANIRVVIKRKNQLQTLNYDIR